MRKEGYVIIVGIILSIIGNIITIKSLLPTRSDELSQQITAAGYFKEIGLIVIVVGIILLIVLPDFSKKNTTN
jgi:hypothetical protein